MKIKNNSVCVCVCGQTQATPLKYENLMLQQKQVFRIPGTESPDSQHFLQSEKFYSKYEHQMAFYHTFSSCF